MAMNPDRSTIRLVAGLLGAVCVLALAGIVVLAALAVAVPDALPLMATTALGSLASLLVTTRQPSEPA